jgi:hypothetical protein
MLEKKQRPLGSFDTFEVKLSTGLLNGPVTHGFTERRRFHPLCFSHGDESGVPCGRGEKGKFSPPGLVIPPGQW